MQDLFPLTPIGSIMMWSGTISNKSPTDINGLTYTKWKICDGTNGTPDLRNRFIVGSGSNYNIGNTGGADNVTLTTAQMPSHNHTLTIDANGSHNHGMSNSGSHLHKVNNMGDGSQEAIYVYFTNNRGNLDAPVGGGNGNGQFDVGKPNYSQHHHSSGDHTHTINEAGSHNHTSTMGNTGSGQSHENRPPYYALAFIMRIV